MIVVGVVVEVLVVVAGLATVWEGGGAEAGAGTGGAAGGEVVEVGTTADGTPDIWLWTGFELFEAATATEAAAGAAMGVAVGTEESVETAEVAGARALDWSELDSSCFITFTSLPLTADIVE